MVWFNLVFQYSLWSNIVFQLSLWLILLLPYILWLSGAFEHQFLDRTVYQERACHNLIEFANIWTLQWIWAPKLDKNTTFNFGRNSVRCSRACVFHGRGAYTCSRARVRACTRVPHNAGDTFAPSTIVVAIAVIAPDFYNYILHMYYLLSYLLYIYWIWTLVQLRCSFQAFSPIPNSISSTPMLELPSAP